MKFESDLQVLRHSDEAVEGARAEEEDGMATNWEGTEMDELLEAFRRNMPFINLCVGSLICLPNVSIWSLFLLGD